MTLKAPVWTWEVPAYFFLGGVATGSSFVALAADLSGDHRSAQRFRSVALAAAAPCGPLLVSDLGRPGRFLNMLRIVKPRSPMNTGAWALAGFTGATAGAVWASVVGRSRLARGLGGAAATIGVYLGSYTGVLLAATAVPVWSSNRTRLGPLFVSSATATGAAACRLVSTSGATGDALDRVQDVAVIAETALGLTTIGGHSEALSMVAHGGAIASLFVRRRNPRAASLLTLGSGLALRYGWLAAGRRSATSAATIRAPECRNRPPTPAFTTPQRAHWRFGGHIAAAYAEAVRRASLFIEGTVRRARR